MPRVKSENLVNCLTCVVDDEVKYVIKCTPFRDTYFLYETVNGECVKTPHKASTPTQLYKYMDEEPTKKKRGKNGKK